MAFNKHANMYGYWYLNELGTRVVAQSGKPGDMFHLGKLTLQAFKDAPDFMLQIDAGTKESETCSSVLTRSVQCAHAFRELGLQTGDVIILMAPNHLDLCIPFYAALYLGVAIAPIDMTLGVRELCHMFSKDEPKMVFCQSERIEAVGTALEKANLKTKIVTFDETKDKAFDSISFAELLKIYGQDVSVENFKASDFDTDTTLSFLISTSGSTGLPKQAAHTHKTFVLFAPTTWMSHYTFPTPTRLALLLSPLQWATGILQLQLGALFRYTRVQTSSTMDVNHIFHIINEYKPTQFIISPTLLTTLIKHSKGRCNWSSFDSILVGGGAVSQELINEMKELSPGADVFNGYGMSEMGGVAFQWNNVPKSSGQPSGQWQYRLINLDTQEDIKEPHIKGELWARGPSLFKGYYKDEEATKAVVTPDGWFKTGDLFYRDEYWNYFFVERIKMLLKYKNHQVSPEEIQEVIRQHPGVLDVAVCGYPDDECGELPTAVVVRRPGHSVSAEDIKNLVKENLADTKQLRGGVIFLDEFPTLPSGKLNYGKLKELVLQLDRE